MIIQTKHIKGKGRGRELGFPTMNFTVPDDMHIDDGVYAAWIIVDGKPYKGALHYGSTPTFGETGMALEAFLLDITDETFPDTAGKVIELDIVEKIRDIKRFIDPADLSEAIARDVEKIGIILK